MSITYTLGINAYHGDSSACIYRNDELIAATEEERILRIKHWAGLPVEAIKFCLDEAGISLKEVDTITVSRDPKAKLGQKIVQTLKKGISLKAVKDRGANSLKITKIKSDIAEALGHDADDIKAKVFFAEHHRSHMASAFFVSPFEESAILSIDGMGDFSSTMRGTGKANSMDVIDSVSYPHSIGIFYTAFTQYLGFPHYGDEYKVMGLSPYGNATMVDELKDVVKLLDNGLFELNEKYFKHFKDGVAMDWEGGSPSIEAIYSDALVEKFGPVRQKGEELTQYHMDLAASVQRYTEQIIFHMAEDLYKRTGLKNLCITGGVAQNSVANGKLLANTSFEKLFVPPAGHDAGTSVGSALYYLHQEQGLPRAEFKHQPYTGAQFSNEEIGSFLRDKQGNITFVEDDTELIKNVAQLLHEGNVIGWFQGRAEFGPRALGNRSIIVDPSRSDAKDLLNSKIKRRESFRPFAPSILKDATAEYFEVVDDVPFMEKVYKIRKEKHDVIPAVTHVDGTGRLQTVEQRDNPRYYNLIKTFSTLSGIPILLNTSFNENEPIVNTPAHAYDCFARTEMDVLVLGNYIIKRA
jgi:carbamoyltransferase